MSSPRTLTDKEGSIHGILSFLRRAFGRGGALLSSLRQGNSHCPPLPAVRRAPARREPFLQRLRRSRRRRCSGCIRYAAAPPGSAARNSPGPGPHHHSPHLKWHRLLHRLQCHRRTAPPSQGYACLLCRIREISPAPCSAFSAQTAAVTHSKAPECTAFWNRFP